MSADRWATVEQLYHAALEHSPSERAAFLNSACGTDDELRLEVESLLTHDADAGAFLEQPAVADAARRIARAAVTSQPRPQIRGYRLLELLGEGGMGIVYLAEQATPLRRRVALKLIRPGMDSRQILARFEVERQALALMDHPNIAAVFDAGATSDGRPYVAMEYVKGVPITTYSDHQRLSTRARLELFIKTCAAVQHAHQKGVIHRDLKPSNVLVAEQDGQPVPKVIDFGTAKATERSATGADTLTGQGVVLGTLEYMSPEQAALSRDIDTATDIYSLGVLLFELLVGTVPFPRPSSGADGYDELRRQIRESDPPRPSARLTADAATARTVAEARRTDITPLARQLRGDLDAIVMKALEKDRRHRYATVAAFAADVQKSLADERIEARPPSAVYRVGKFVRRYRGAVAAASALLILLLAGLTVSAGLYWRADRALREAEYRTYVASIAAADGEVRANQPRAAQARLLAVPAAWRGWEWHHLYRRTDNSLATLRGGPCTPDDRLAGHRRERTDTLQLGLDGKHVYWSRCDRLERWDAATTHHAASIAPDRSRILSADAAGRMVVVAAAGSQSWQVRLIQPSAAAAAVIFGPFDLEPAALVSARTALMLRSDSIPPTRFTASRWTTCSRSGMPRPENSSAD